LLDHHNGENPSDLRGKTQRPPVHQFYTPRHSKRKKVDSNEDDPDNLDEIVNVCDMDDVADSHW
jgi:hypothetical protein